MVFRSESGDILLGLPAPDISCRLDEPARAPQFLRCAQPFDESYYSSGGSM
jgi:hypothetical protein